MRPEEVGDIRMKGTKVLTLGAVDRLRTRMRKFVGVHNYSVNTRAVQIRS